MSIGAKLGNWEINSVSKEDDYRAFAAQSLELAARTSNPKDKSHLLAMAEAWLNLADKITRLVKRPTVGVGEHPAVNETFGPVQREAD